MGEGSTTPLRSWDTRKKSTPPEGGDTDVVFAAAIFHDVEIPASENKYGSVDGRYQEKLGPPIAREILHKLGVDTGLIDHVCDIVIDHHSAKFMDTTEFRMNRVRG